MPKRKNPFDDSYSLQKIHIGIKEVVNLGVNQDANMKKVYENTMKMLYNGSVKNPNGDLKVQNGTCCVPNGYINGNSYSNLIHKLKEEKHSLPSERQGKVSAMNPCCTSNQQVICSFCERILCIICCRTCHVCSYNFCHLCSILKYDSEEETSVCLSCT